MTNQTFFILLVCSATVWFSFLYRHDLRHFFLSLWYGKEKYSHIKNVRYTTPMCVEEEKLKKSIDFLLEKQYKFSYEERKNLLNVLEKIDNQKFSWKEKYHYRFCGLAFPFTYK